MQTSKVAKRYAQGLLDFTRESGQTQAVMAEMKDIVKAMKESRELKNFFQTPFIDQKQKQTTAAMLFSGFSPVTKKLVSLVIKQGRIGHLQDIAQEYINKMEDAQGIQRITLTTASDLSQQTVQDILQNCDMVKADQGSDVTKIINPDILGGYILRVGDQQIDASVRSKLAGIKKEFQIN